MMTVLGYETHPMLIDCPFPLDALYQGTERDRVPVTWSQLPRFDLQL